MCEGLRPGLGLGQGLRERAVGRRLVARVLRTAAVWKTGRAQQTAEGDGKVRLPQEEGKDSPAFLKGTELPAKTETATVAKPAARRVMA